MDQSPILREIEDVGDASEVNDTVTEVPDSSTDADKFLSVDASQTAVTFDVSISMEEPTVNKTQPSGQFESIIGEDSVIAEAVAFDVSTSMDASAGDSHRSVIDEECENSQATAYDVNSSLEVSAAPLQKLSQMEVEDNSAAEMYDSMDETSFFQCSMLELGRYLWPTGPEKQCYTKGCLWSPDGTCCLVPVHMDGMHLVELPDDLYQGDITLNRPLTKLSSAVHVKEGGTVYDCAWYPFMNSADPATCCWLASRQHEPIQMWDAFNGDLRATYRGYDDVDEIEAAISVIFSSDGQHVFGGYKKCIRIFNTNIPGRNSTKLVTKQAISCFALTPNTTDIITTGSWNGVINLYDQRVPNMGSLSSLFGHKGGITFLKYTNNGEMLLSGARKDDSICLWDMRNFSEPVAVLSRRVSTNQRIYFDLSPQNEWLISGDTGGLIRIWNLKDIDHKQAFRIHEDSCNGVNFHPSKPIIATSSGQYHFVDSADANDPEEIVVDYENSLVFWWIKPRISK